MTAIKFGNGKQIWPVPILVFFYQARLKNVVAAISHKIECAIFSMTCNHDPGAFWNYLKSTFSRIRNVFVKNIIFH